MPYAIVLAVNQAPGIRRFPARIRYAYAPARVSLFLVAHLLDASRGLAYSLRVEKVVSSYLDRHVGERVSTFAEIVP